MSPTARTRLVGQGRKKTWRRAAGPGPVWLREPARRRPRGTGGEVKPVDAKGGRSGRQVRPDAAVQVDGLDAVAAQEVGGAGAAAADGAVDDDLAVLGDLGQAALQGAERDEGRAVDVGFLPFVGLAHVEEEDLGLVATEGLGEDDGDVGGGPRQRAGDRRAFRGQVVRRRLAHVAAAPWPVLEGDGASGPVPGVEEPESAGEGRPGAPTL